MSDIKRYVYISMTDEQYQAQSETLWNLKKVGQRISNVDIEAAMEIVIKNQNEEIEANNGVHKTFAEDCYLIIRKNESDIESQKEEIEQLEEERDQALKDYESACTMSSENSRAALSLSDEVESLKAIKELVVKALREISDGGFTGEDARDMWRTANSTLSEIERLQNATS